MIMATDVSIPAAAAAGLLSFLSPCVLPLVPPYLCFLAGATIEDLAHSNDSKARTEAALAGLCFVCGFSTVFVLLGATASVLGALLRQYLDVLGFLAGLAIIIMGLHFLGFFRIPLLYREARMTVHRGPGLLSAYVMGLAFAFGWTPCIGPILAAILSVAGANETVEKGALLLAVYSLGLGLPFIIGALAMGPFVRFLRRFRQYFGAVEKFVGAALVLTGVAFLTGGLQRASFWLLETFPALSNLG
jgi:cytochrome c-type biogenesis protein